MLVKSLLLILITFCSTNVFAQFKIEGNVKNLQTKEAIAFAHISIVKTNYGTVSNINGDFFLSIPKRDSIYLQISAIGYQTKTILYEKFPLDISLKPTAKILDEVDILPHNLTAEQIVKIAFKAVKKNYFRDPIVLKSFYRHYCKEDSIFGRLIDAQVDIYKKKGYRRIEKSEYNKDLFAVNELRRSFDNTDASKTSHRPMVLDMLLQSDIAALKQASKVKNKIIHLVLGGTNFINSKASAFNFELESMTKLDDEKVYKISYQLKKSYVKKKINRDVNYTGHIYIQSNNFAILKLENNVIDNEAHLEQEVTYKNYNGKYAISHSNIILTVDSPKRGVHQSNIELTVHDIEIGKRKDINQTRVTREYLASIPYRENFWNQYSSEIEIAIPDSISQDLNVEQDINKQFTSMSEFEANLAIEVKQQEDSLYSMINNNKGILVVDLWAAWCGPCIEEFKMSENIRAELKQKGVKFLMVSLDDSSSRWKVIIQMHKMEKENHLRVGPNTTYLDNIDMESIPRYIIYQNENLINDDAPRPHTKEFVELIENLLQQNKTNN